MRPAVALAWPCDVLRGARESGKHKANRTRARLPAFLPALSFACGDRATFFARPWIGILINNDRFYPSRLERDPMVSPIKGPGPNHLCIDVHFSHGEAIARLATALPIETQTELHLTHRATDDDSRNPAGVRGTGVNAAVRVCQVRPIEDVKHFPAKLKRFLLGYGKAFS